MLIFLVGIKWNSCMHSSGHITLEYGTEHTGDEVCLLWGKK